MVNKVKGYFYLSQIFFTDGIKSAEGADNSGIRDCSGGTDTENEQ